MGKPYQKRFLFLLTYAWFQTVTENGHPPVCLCGSVKEGLHGARDEDLSGVGGASDRWTMSFGQGLARTLQDITPLRAAV